MTFPLVETGQGKDARLKTADLLKLENGMNGAYL